MIDFSPNDLKFKKIKKGEALFRVGEVCDSCFVLMKGQVCSFRVMNGRAVPIFLHQENEIIADESSFKREFICNATAIVDSELVVIDSSEIHEYLKHNPNWIADILTEISVRIEKSIHVLEDHQIVNTDIFPEGYHPEIEKLLLTSLEQD